MAGYKKGDVDLDLIFMALSGTKRADVGYNIGDSDISNSYEPIGSGTKVADVGYKVGGTDISNYFRDIDEPIGGTFTLNLSGGTFNHISSSVVCRAGIRLNADGTVDKRIGSTYTQVGSTDWIDPESAASGDFRARMVNVVWTSGSSFDVEAAAENTWVDLDVDREWTIYDTDSSSSGNKSVTFDLVIEHKTLPHSTGNVEYSLAANYTP